MSQNKRQFDRLDLTKLAFAREGEKAHGGLLKDISATGAYIEFVYPLGRVEHSFSMGDRIELVLEDETILVGKVARVEKEGVAFHFNPENDDQRGFLEAMVAAVLEEQSE